MTERRHVGELDGARRAQVVVHGDLIFFSGIDAGSFEGDVQQQTASALARVDELLAELGEDQASILMVHVWLKDMRYFSGLNAAWNSWADPESPPARTCVSGELFRPDALVEFVVTAGRVKGGAG